MASRPTIEVLKQWLLNDVAYLSRRTDVKWNSSIVDTVRELRHLALPAVYFGGTLRSLLLGRLSGGRRLGRPRDLDIVVADDSIDRLRERLHSHILRETRFGGVKIERDSLQFDLWPLLATWAFKEDHSLHASFETLPQTTFFNLEAVAVDVWVKAGTSRKVYSGDNRFFDGILSKTIELNRESNPFPALCIVRSLVLAASTHFAIGTRLARYLAHHAENVSDRELDDVQRHHYGCRRLHVDEMRRLLSFIIKSQRQAEAGIRLDLPLGQQLQLWNEDREGYWINIHGVTGRRPRESASE